MHVPFSPPTTQPLSALEIERWRLVGKLGLAAGKGKKKKVKHLEFGGERQ